MRKFYMQLGMALTVALVGLALALPAAAGTLYKWVEADGTVAYTDDAKRIPERYKGAAVKQDVSGLDGYSRFSKLDAVATERQTERLYQRLERLQKLNAGLWGWDSEAAPQMAAPAAATGGRALVQVGSRTAIDVPLAGPGAEPTIVESVRVQPENRVTSRTDTVIRQGDRIQMIVRPDQQWEVDPGDTIDEEDLR